MKISRNNTPVQTITNKMKRENIILKHRLQRREGAWNKFQQSLLIHSLLKGYPTNPVYLISENDKQYVIDGVQRLSTISDYINDKFSSSKGLEPIEIDGNTYDISGKKYSKLEQPVKDEIMSAQIQAIEISNYDDKDVREMFSRLNGGKALNSSQQLTPYMGEDMYDAVSNILSHPFFEKVLSPTQLINSIDLAIAIETLMLSEASKDYDFGSFSKADKKKFIMYYNDNVDFDKVTLIKQGLNKLDAAFDNKVNMPKTSISFIIYFCYRVEKDKKNSEKGINIVKEFLDTYETNDDYKNCIGQGTNSKDSVHTRLDYWRAKIKELSV